MCCGYRHIPQPPPSEKKTARTDIPGTASGRLTDEAEKWRKADGKTM